MLQTPDRAGGLPPFEYAPSRASLSSLELRERYGLYIGGEWLAASGGTAFATIDPATENVLAQIAYAELPDVDRAVRAARRGYDKYWRKLSGAERAKYLFRLARAVADRAQQFAILETLDGGKPIRRSREVDVPQAHAHFFHHAGWADKLAWAVQGPERARPLGVVAALAPHAVPLWSAARKVAPALACGNTVVLKPSETTPLSALLLAEACRDADMPPGVVNVVTGDARTGALLVEHEAVNAVAFGGTVEAGKAVRRTIAGTAKRCSLELGARSAILVFDDAPLDQAIEGIVSTFYGNATHLTSAGARLLVQESIAAEVIERLRERLKTLRHGDPLDENTDVGPLPSRAQRDAARESVAAAVADGAEAIAAPWTPPERGFWMPATFLSGVQPSHRIARDDSESAAPALLTFRTPDEAIARANAAGEGLSAAVWSSTGALALYAAQRLTAGVVWCDALNRFDPSAPYGGRKTSGLGREGGIAGLREYLET